MANIVDFSLNNVGPDGKYVASIPDEKNHFLIASKEADQWFLMSSPWPVLSIVTFYLLFVMSLGPHLMKNRKPLNIKPIILIYNLFQTIYNTYIVSLMFTDKGALQYAWEHACHPIDRAINPYYYLLNSGSWFYFISKLIDLLDTVFFILRKKESHVTFLHVYHHTNMALTAWAYLKFIKGEQGLIIGVLNSSVHVVMYGYYFLAALGPEMQKYLWWKKYITRLQMLQFVVIIIYIGSLIVKKCDLPHFYSVWIIFQAIIFFILFANFYVQTYYRKSPEKQRKATAVKMSGHTSSISEDKKEK